MGLFSGSVTYSKFYVDGEPPRNFRTKYLERIRLRAFRPLKPDDEEDERVGWCVAGNALDTDHSVENVFSGGYLLLGLRVDKYRLPSVLLKAHYTEAQAALLAKSGRERLTKTEKAGLRQQVTAALRRRTLPAMKAVDLCWDLDGHVAYFCNQSQRMHDLVGMLFERTFGFELDANSPYMTASSLGLASRQLDALARLEPTAFYGGKR